MRSISSLPRRASRRNELAVIDPPGKAICAAFSSRSGVSGPITAPVDNAISLITDTARTLQIRPVFTRLQIGLLKRLPRLHGAGRSRGYVARYPQEFFAQEFVKRIAS